MAFIQCSECGKKYSEKATACPNCGCPNSNNAFKTIEFSNAENSISQDKVSRSEIIKHLSYAVFLEKAIYTYDKIYSQLQQKIDSLGHKRQFAKPQISESFSAAQLPFLAFFPIFLVTLIIMMITGGHFWEELICIITVVLIFFSPAVLTKIFSSLLISLGIVLVLCLVLFLISYSSHREEEKRYKNNLKWDEARVAKEQKMINELKREQKTVAEKYGDCVLLLEQLYDLNIIFPKYRHMVAVTTILEYFESGRCSSLTGAHGAYDTYSYEEKQNIIIGKLDTVIDMLDEIKQTQYMLYNAIQESNSIANRIYSQSERLLETNNQIKENTFLIAYNSEVIKQNTTISAYIDVFSYMEH